MPNYNSRLEKVQQQMLAQGVDLLFLQRSANLHYVTGLPREEQNFGNTMYPGEWLSGAWISPHKAPILTVPRMLADFHLGGVEGYDLRVLSDSADPSALARDVLEALGVAANATIALDERAWAETLMNIQALRPEAYFRSASPLMRPLRLVKDDDELAIMRHAGEITEAAYRDTLAKLRHGMTTLDLITEVNYQLKKYGSTAPSFVTSFYNMGESFPFAFHNRDEVMNIPLDAPVSVSFDFGSVYDGYCYDFGRSVFFGEPSAEYRRVYDLVMGAQAAGIAALKAGSTCEAADRAARAVIVEGGYGEAFRHRLGHGIGMDVHEPPFLTEGDTTELREGMCFTIEPSIFIPHRFGARVEDVVVVGTNGGRPMTSGFQRLHVV